MRRGILLFTLLLFCSFSLLAEPLAGNLSPTNSTIKTFDVTQANRWLDQLTMTLAIQQTDAKYLAGALTELSHLKELSNKCITNTQKQIDETSKLWNESKIDTKPNEEELTSLQKYLKNKKDNLIQQNSECKLFALRANEVISVLHRTVEQLNKEALLKTKPTGITALGNIAQFTQQIKELKILGPLQERLSSSLNKTSIIGFLLLVSLSAAIATLLSYFVYKKYRQKTPQDFAEKFKISLLLSLAHYSFLIALSIILFIFCFILHFIYPVLAPLNLISIGLLSYAFTIFLTHLLFYTFKGNTSLVDISKAISNPLAFRIKSLLTLTLIGYFAYLLSKYFEIPLGISGFIRTIFITLYAIGLISLLWLINRLPTLFHHRQGVRTIISCFLTLSLLTILFMEWSGYQQLVTYILQGIALTLALTFITALLHKIISYILDYFAKGQASWQYQVRKAFGIQNSRLIPEFIWLKLALIFLIWCSYIIILLKVWNMSDASFRHTLGKLINGFNVAGIDIIPLRIFSAIIFFIIASLLIRWLKHYLENRKAETIDKGTQQALASIIGYIGIAIILLFVLLVAGVNFAGLAIVAGALSVGIGFGLQNIVNNFVSGIILLIERPIKPGDRIIVGNVEGFVKKISIRSTQIQTLQLSDLIVPNSEIISGQVTNLMFHNYYGRVDTKVGVAYGTDTELVRNLLFEVAKNHPEVIHEDPQFKPLIFLTEFGDNSLVFNMYCIIRDVNLKYIVASEIRLAIDAIFKANNVVIAFPQRVIHFSDENEPHKKKTVGKHS